MASLRGKSPKESFSTLLKLSDTQATTTLQNMTDGEGNTLPISISKTNVAIQGLAWPTTGAGPGKILTVNEEGEALEWATIVVPPPVEQVQMAPHILKANFVGAVSETVGVSRFYPPQQITISGVYCGLSVPGSATIEVDVKVDGTSIFTTEKPSLANGQFRSQPVVVSKIVEPTSFVTVDVLKASGSDLVVYIIYT